MYCHCLTQLTAKCYIKTASVGWRRGRKSARNCEGGEGRGEESCPNFSNKAKYFKYLSLSHLKFI